MKRKPKDKPLSPEELLQKRLARLMEIRTGLTQVYGERWDASCGTIHGARRAVVAAGLDAEVASYVAAIHFMLPLLAEALAPKREENDAV